MIEAGLAIIAEPMTENEVDDMLRNNDHDNTYDLVESVEYWFGIREVAYRNFNQGEGGAIGLHDAAIKRAME